nr:hypothetical protein [Candidatus Sigynarchaeota archaeon]
MLDELWIMQQDGILLYYRVAEEKQNQALFGSFMSAIEAFANKIDLGNMTSFKLGSKKFILKKNHDLYFIADFPAGINLKKAEAVLSDLSNLFISTYHDELRDFSGNITPFKGFDDKIKEYMDTYWILT